MHSWSVGIPLLEREPRNAVDQYHSNQHRIASDCIATNCKHLTIERLFYIVRRHTKQYTTTTTNYSGHALFHYLISLSLKNLRVFDFRTPAGHPNIPEHLVLISTCMYMHTS